MGNWNFCFSRKAKLIGFPFQRHFRGNILFYNDLSSVFFPTFFEPKIVSSSPCMVGVPCNFVVKNYNFVISSLKKGALFCVKNLVQINSIYSWSSSKKLWQVQPGFPQPGKTWRSWKVRFFLKPGMSEIS